MAQEVAGTQSHAAVVVVIDIQRRVGSRKLAATAAEERRSHAGVNTEEIAQGLSIVGV